MSIFEILKENVQLAKESVHQGADFVSAKAAIARTEAEIAKKHLTLGTRVDALHREQGLQIEGVADLLEELDKLQQELRLHRAKDDARGSGDEVVNHPIPEGRLESDRRRLDP